MTGTGQKMDQSGVEPETFRMRNGRDSHYTTSPRSVVEDVIILAMAKSVNFQKKANIDRITLYFGLKIRPNNNPTLAENMSDLPKHSNQN